MRCKFLMCLFCVCDRIAILDHPRYKRGRWALQNRSSFRLERSEMEKSLNFVRQKCLTFLRYAKGILFYRKRPACDVFGKIRDISSFLLNFNLKSQASRLRQIASNFKNKNGRQNCQPSIFIVNIV